MGSSSALMTEQHLMTSSRMAVPEPTWELLFVEAPELRLVSALSSRVNEESLISVLSPHWYIHQNLLRHLQVRKLIQSAYLG